MTFFNHFADILYMDFFNRLKACVQAKNETIDWLCDKVGYNRRTYASARAANRTPPFDIVVKMSKALDVSLDYLAYGFEPKRDLSSLKPPFKEIVSNLLELSPENIKHVDAIIAGLLGKQQQEQTKKESRA